MKKLRRIELTCNNLSKFSEILTMCSFNTNSVGRKFGSIEVITKELIEEELCKISEDNPEIIFLLEVSNMDYYHQTSYKSEIQNGIEEQRDFKVNYGVNSYDPQAKEELGDLYDTFYETGIEVFRRMDIVKEADDGKKYIDIVESLVLNVEDESYLMKLIKNGSMVNIKCYSKDHKTELTEIESEEEDLPF